MEVDKPDPAREVVGRRLHGKRDRTGEQHANRKEIVELFQKPAGVGQEMHFVEKERAESVVGELTT